MSNTALSYKTCQKLINALKVHIHEKPDSASLPSTNAKSYPITSDITFPPGLN